MERFSSYADMLERFGDTTSRQAKKAAQSSFGKVKIVGELRQVKKRKQKRKYKKREKKEDDKQKVSSPKSKRKPEKTESTSSKRRKSVEKSKEDEKESESDSEDESSSESEEEDKKKTKRKSIEDRRPIVEKQNGKPEKIVHPKASKPNYEKIFKNIYIDVERLPKKQRMEEVTECECRLIPGIAPCGEGCMNRLMQHECNKTVCNCGALCTNQRFQKRQYAKLELIGAGDKGNGLKAKQDIQPGQFVIEYVGEVISTEKCQDRLEAYQFGNHVYFLALDANSCIDAGNKGNYARFINHSCNPNCETQKWYVDGELRIGIFAIREIRNGQELTFDYQFQRFGRKKQKCHCGEPNCRGYLGEKPKQYDDPKKKIPQPVQIDPETQLYLEHNRAIFVSPEDHLSTLNAELEFPMRRPKIKRTFGYLQDRFAEAKEEEIVDPVPFLRRNIRSTWASLRLEVRIIEHGIRKKRRYT